ncbi:hypothetical protein ABLN73_09495 [Mycobacterium tuberculosis]
MEAAIASRSASVGMAEAVHEKRAEFHDKCENMTLSDFYRG